MIPSAAIPQRILSCHEFGTARLTHRLGEVGAIEGQALRGETIQVGCLRVLSSVGRQVAERAVVCHDNQNVRSIFGDNAPAKSEENATSGESEVHFERICGRGDLVNVFNLVVGSRL